MVRSFISSVFGGVRLIKVIGVYLDSLQSKCYVSPNNLELSKGQVVIVETDNGLQIGDIVTDISLEKEENVVLPLKKVLRLATKEDLKKRDYLKKEAEKALRTAKEYAKDLKLNMVFVDANYTFEKSQLFFSFVADSRVDFRELAKRLAQKYKTRIELRQIGVRDKAKKIGGLGPCGLFLCCHSFLTDFNIVSKNMAKNQMLALNPSKINGVCGRLLCCLNYEDDTYKYLKKDLPSIGTVVQKKEGTGKVVAVNIFKKTYQVDLGSKGVQEYSNEK